MGVQLEQAKRSPGMGLALSYFYNFILPTASNMNRPGMWDSSYLINFTAVAACHDTAEK
jgi:hypothetical protein